jgi:hypothetical protein
MPLSLRLQPHRVCGIRNIVELIDRDHRVVETVQVDSAECYVKQPSDQSSDSVVDHSGREAEGRRTLGIFMPGVSLASLRPLGRACVAHAHPHGRDAVTGVWNAPVVRAEGKHRR